MDPDDLTLHWTVWWFDARGQQIGGISNNDWPNLTVAMHAAAVHAEEDPFIAENAVSCRIEREIQMPPGEENVWALAA